MSGYTPGDASSVRQLFETIAPRYDQLNDLLSFGLHRLWKRQALLALRPQPGQRLLDLCCGTGDLALLLGARVRPGGQVLAIDAAAAPLQQARQRAARQPWLPIRWQHGDALASGLGDGWADGAVMAYGLRNLGPPGPALAELRRLLRRGGRAAVLDFNRPDPADGRSAQLAAAVQRHYLRRVVVPAAAAYGLAEAYAYLEDSLRRFPTARAQQQLALEAGFEQARHRPLAGGLMGCLELVA
ncbi:MAG: ubiquinone/menaquinone biosynthesis methyltransferase [Cyanobacteriota bacterium]|nr:ubiquinone/menaquinone biosynthesis methyltransferase [Cyanobacteriota bacterium]